MVNLTRIYTRTGDDGTTGLGDFSRTSKNDPRLIAYADVDEANSAIGVVLAAAGSWSTAHPSRRSSSAMMRTSRMSGTSISVLVPSVSSAAAMSLRTLFFAPGTRTSPSSRAPPTTLNASTGVDGRGGPWRQWHRHGPAVASP